MSPLRDTTVKNVFKEATISLCTNCSIQTVSEVWVVAKLWGVWNVAVNSWGFEREGRTSESWSCFHRIGPKANERQSANEPILLQTTVFPTNSTEMPAPEVVIAVAFGVASLLMFAMGRNWPTVNPRRLWGHSHEHQTRVVPSCSCSWLYQPGSPAASTTCRRAMESFPIVCSCPRWFWANSQQRQ